MSPDRPTDDERAVDLALRGPSPRDLDALDTLDLGRVEALERAAAMASLAMIDPAEAALPAGLRARLLADAAAHFAPRPARRPRRVAPWLGWPIAAAALVALAVTPRARPPAEPALSLGPWSPLAATDHPLARGAAGQLAWDRDRNRGVLRLTGLAAVDPRQGTYQLWIIDARRDPRYPIDGGTFVVADPSGTTVVPIRPSLPVGEASLYAVTLEPPGGVVVSDRKRMMLAGPPAG